MSAVALIEAKNRLSELVDRLQQASQGASLARLKTRDLVREGRR